MIGCQVSAESDSFSIHKGVSVDFGQSSKKLISQLLLVSIESPNNFLSQLGPFKGQPYC